MKNLPLLFLGIFFTLAFSWTGLILSSHIQLGALEPATEQLVNPSTGDAIVGVTATLQMEDGTTRKVPGRNTPGMQKYPVEPVGLAQQGKQVYMSLGCMYCHSQQVRHPDFGNGADIARNWGIRGSVSRDYILQDRVMLGTMRTGPDLAAVGNRLFDQAGRDWHHSHLWDPQITSPGSLMPPFRFLYEVRPIGSGPPKYRVQIPEGHPSAPPPGYEVVPTDDAVALVEYLLSLRVDYALPEAPIPEAF